MEENISYLQQLNDSFLAAERSYRIAKRRVRSGKYEKVIEEVNGKFVFKEVENINYRNALNIPTSNLAKFFFNLRRSGKLKREIENKWLDNDKNYFAFLEYKMDGRFKFIKEACGDKVSFYFTEKDKANNLIHRLRHTGTTLSQEEMLLAMQLDFLDLFKAFEDLILNSYPGYVKRMNFSFEEEPPRETPHILLRYDSHNSEVIKDLYKALSEVYIEGSFSDFAKHFTVTDRTLPKIKWNKKLSLLCAIFNGMKLQDQTAIPGVETSNYSTYKMIASHFCYPDGKDRRNEACDR